MEHIYSKTDPTTLLHRINRLADIVAESSDLSSEKEFLQVRPLRLQQGRSFRPHRHVWKDGEAKTITQECWIVIQGKIQGVFYDLDGQMLAETELLPGDCAITFQGGHNLICLEDNTVVYEIKTGPYRGKEYDKLEI